MTKNPIAAWNGLAEWQAIRDSLHRIMKILGRAQALQVHRKRSMAP